jgi:ABC-2 type transport system permease protein
MMKSVIPHLIWKDWQLHRTTVMASLGAGVVTLVLFLSSGNGLLKLLSIISFFVTMIVLASLLPSLCLVGERKNHTLAFLMSLPLSSIQYTIAKLVAALGIFMIPWLTLLIAGVAIILSRADLPNGLIPLFLALCTLVLVGLCLIASVSLVTESEGWGIAATVAVNISYNFAWIFIISSSGIRSGLQSPTAVWDSTILSLLGGEFAIIVLVLGLTFFLQSRKKDFI